MVSWVGARARRGQQGLCRSGKAGARRAGVASGRGPRPDRELPGLGKTLLVRVLGRAIGLLVQSHPVHARPDAFRRHRLADLRRTVERFPFPARPGLHPAPAGGRDQSGARQDSLGAPGDHAGEPGDGRRRELSDRAAVLGDGDPEPDRIGRDVQLARGPARSVSVQAGGRVSHGRRGDGHPAAAHAGDGAGPRVAERLAW